MNTQNKHINGLTSGWLRKPSLPIFTNRYRQAFKMNDMKVIHNYDTQIKEWKHEPIEKFMGKNSEIEFKLGLGISAREPRNPDVCYFNVVVQRKIENQVHGEVFKALIQKTFMVEVGNEKPSVEFYFDLIEKTTYEFARIFHQKIENTNLQGRKTQKPNIQELRPEIQAEIDRWYQTIREAGLN